METFKVAEWLPMWEKAAPTVNHMSPVMRKPAFCICENKDADQLRGNREADQRLCFRHTDSAIPLLSKSEISSLLPSSVVVQPDLCQTWLETPKNGFLTTRLICSLCFFVSCLFVVFVAFHFVSKDRISNLVVSGASHC